ncbi:MAG: tRNA (guanine(10)-N(2))-dimethyltransferase [Candidatus Bathyarchaeia archaeon]
MENEDLKIDFPTEIVKEGAVKVLVPKFEAFAGSPSTYIPSKAPVFYNPIMELNRDIAVLALQVHQKILNRKISVCEPLTGCGIRGIRFAAEVEGVKKVLINDIDEKAFHLAKYNIQMNSLSGRAIPKNEDANRLLSRYGAPRKRFDAIDLDPFGSPAPYMDSAIRALRDNGLLALTATDMAPLCGVHPKACIRKYGGKSLRTEYCHELAVRLLAGCLAMSAAKHEMGIEIVLSHSTDHYIRVYATLKYGAKRADDSIKNMGYILHCFKCFHREPVRGLFQVGRSGVCRKCGSKMDIAGPLWLGRIFDEKFCSLIGVEAKKRRFRLGMRVEKILNLIKNETDAPITYYVIDRLCDALNLPVPPVKRVIEALKDYGFNAYQTHFNPKGIRTDASVVEVKEILKKIAKPF